MINHHDPIISASDIDHQRVTRAPQDDVIGTDSGLQGDHIAVFERTIAVVDEVHTRPSPEAVNVVSGFAT
ncbi:hypothetical protein D3C71_1730920 [compost metagenome]